MTWVVDRNSHIEKWAKRGSFRTPSQPISSPLLQGLSIRIQPQNNFYHIYILFLNAISGLYQLKFIVQRNRPNKQPCKRHHLVNLCSTSGKSRKCVRVSSTAHYKRYKATMELQMTPTALFALFFVLIVNSKVIK